MLLQTEELCHKTDNIQYCQIKKRRQNIGRTAQCTKPVTTNTTRNLWHKNCIGQNFSLDTSHMQFHYSRESKTFLEKKIPVSKVQDAIQWYHPRGRTPVHMHLLTLSLNLSLSQSLSLPHTHTHTAIALPHSLHREDRTGLSDVT